MRQYQNSCGILQKLVFRYNKRLLLKIPWEKICHSKISWFDIQHLISTFPEKFGTWIGMEKIPGNWFFKYLNADIKKGKRKFKKGIRSEKERSEIDVNPLPFRKLLSIICYFNFQTMLSDWGNRSENRVRLKHGGYRQWG